jgi:hypothetical protein
MLKALQKVAFVTSAALILPAAAEVGPHALTNLSQELIRIYNAADAAALHQRLAPALQEKYSVEAVRNALARCRVLTHDIFRLSTPTWGARRYGYFAVYAETSAFEMILEIDDSERIVHWVITDNVASENQQCTLNAL